MYSMGHSYRVFCKKCYYEKNLLVGIGIMTDIQFLSEGKGRISLEEFLGEKEATVVRGVLEKQNADVVKEGYRVYRCRNCNCIDTKYFYHIRQENGEDILPKYQCRKCKETMEMLIENKEPIDYFLNEENEKVELTCPKCAKSSMLVGIGPMDWD